MPATCPHCGKPAQDDDALLCLYCGESLRRETGFLGHLKYGTWKFLALLVLALTIASFIFLNIF
ncbi:MAG: zinc-ribbon domain-containing protein [Candidatus Omnitrophica bacterium]|nr:zinc-ribbon domain-containing protein [Candidatus Omnitrophota bacterium]MDD5574011.1 zinc-ribbon domain-containing protein [Candidatus Omnitrophota bacterium]